MKPGFLDKLIERLDKLDPNSLQSLQSQFLRLTREKGFFEALFNAIHEGIVVLDGQGCITYANNAAAGFLGFSLESVARQPISRYIKDLDWAGMVKLDETEWSKLVSREIEITYPAHRFLNFYVMPLDFPRKKDRDGGAVIILRDMTHERERELDVLKSERLNALTLLAAGVAHEIGNPLNSLHIHMQLMERELQALDSQAREPFEALVRVSRTEVERLNLIITQFLRAVRPTTPQRESCAIEDSLQETLSFMKHEIENRDILVEVHCPDLLPKISVDRNQIKQAFFNVIKNALQAMSSGGLLTITLFSNDRNLGISFKDTGTGISAEELSRLFEPYHTTKAHGSGLGLMIVQRIIQDHGGEIEVRTQPSTGTTFTLLLPLDERRIRLLAPKPKRPDKAVREDDA